MNAESEDIKRWTARRKAAAVMDLIKGKTTAVELARSHDPTVAGVEQWMDDFVSMGTEALRKLRLLLENFPKNHNLILFGQSALNTTLQFSINHDIRSRITYSAKINTLATHTITDFIHSQLDRVGLPHHTFTEAATNLIIRSSEGTLHAVKNLCIGALIEAVRDRTKTVDLKQVNAVLLQPHWRHNPQHEPSPQGIVFTNQPPPSQTS